MKTTNLEESKYLMELIFISWQKCFGEILDFEMTTLHGFGNKIHQFKAKVENQTGLSLVDVRSIRNHIKAILNNENKNLPSIKTIEIFCWYILNKPPIKKGDLLNWEKKDFKKRELWEEFQFISSKKNQAEKPPLFFDLKNNSSKKNTFKEIKIESNEFVKLMALGGALSGIIINIIMVSSKVFGGYQNLDEGKLFVLFPTILFFGICMGWVIGFFCGKTIQKINKESSKIKKEFLKIGLFVFCLFFSIITRGVLARDSFFMAGFEEGKGLLGEPNFELLATGLAIAITIIFIVNNLLQLSRLPKWKETVIIATKASIISVFIFAIVYFVFTFLITNHFIEKDT